MEFPPGPRIPSLLQAAFVTASPYGWMVRRWRRYGDVFSSRFPIFGRVVYIADPALVKEVFTGDAVTFHAGEANALALGEALGDHSLLTLDEDRHMSQRKLLLPPFHGESVRRYAEVMVEETAREVATWPVGEEIELRPRMQAITLEVILRAVFGVRDDARMDLFRRAHTAARRAHEHPQLAAVHGPRPRRHHSRGPGAPGARGRRRADLRRDRRAPRRRRRRGARRRDDAAAPRSPRGRLADDGQGAARRANDAAHGWSRDDRHRAWRGHSSGSSARRTRSSGSPAPSTTTTTSRPWSRRRSA